MKPTLMQRKKTGEEGWKKTGGETDMRQRVSISQRQRGSITAPLFDSEIVHLCTRMSSLDVTELQVSIRPSLRCGHVHLDKWVHMARLGVISRSCGGMPGS